GAEALDLARQAQGTVSDQAGAEQGCDLQVGISGWQRETEALVGDGVLGEAGVDLVSGEAGVLAQVLLAATAVAAGTGGRAEPGHADPGRGTNATSSPPRPHHPA